MCHTFVALIGWGSIRVRPEASGHWTNALEIKIKLRDMRALIPFQKHTLGITLNKDLFLFSQLKTFKLSFRETGLTWIVRAKLQTITTANQTQEVEGSPTGFCCLMLVITLVRTTVWWRRRQRARNIYVCMGLQRSVFILQALAVY